MVLVSYTNRDGDRQVRLTEHDDGRYSISDEPAGDGRRPGTYFPLLDVVDTRAEAERVAGRHVALALEFGTYEARAVTAGLCTERRLREEYR